MSNKLKIPIIVAIALLALVAGLFFSGIIGGKPDTKTKLAIEPIPLTEAFEVNLNDPEADYFASMTVALELEPMDQAHYDAFMGTDGGGHGGSTEAPGPAKVASYPKFADAIVSVTSTFSAAELKSPKGKENLRQALLTEFAAIAEKDAVTFKSGKADSAHVGPPYHVFNVYFPKYIVSPA